MRRLVQLILGLIVLAISSDAFPSSSSQTIIDAPDCVSGTVPGSGCLYVQAGTLGVDIRGPAGSTLGFVTSDIAGGGPVHIKQGGREAYYGGATSTVPLGAMMTPGGTVFLSAGTTLLAPDFSFNAANGGGTSYVRASPLGANIDWIGGIGAPTAPGATVTGGGGVFGSRMEICNTGGGNGINVWDGQVGGSLRLEQPIVNLGFLECIGFLYDNSGWLEQSRSGQYYYTGGNRGGGRTIQTTNAVATMIMPYPKGGGSTPGIAAMGDISAQLSGGTGTTSATWLGVKCGIDGASNVILPIVVTTQFGTNAGAPPTGWAISCVVGASNLEFRVTGVAATNINWRANNFQSISPPF